MSQSALKDGYNVLISVGCIPDVDSWIICRGRDRRVEDGENCEDEEELSVSSIC